MKYLSMMLALTLALSGPASFGNGCAEQKKICLEMSEAYETAIAEQRLVIQAQDKMVGNLREQRDLALKGSGGGFFGDYLVPVLIGAAAATVIIGIRR